MHFIDQKIYNKIKKETSTNSPLVIDLRLENYKKKPLFSLIIPVFQEHKIIEKHLKIYTAKIKRKFNFELIVSDGGSNDGTIEIARKYADFLVIHNSNQRQTIAEGRNNGANIANADTLVFLNADTIPYDIDKFFKVISDFALKIDKYKSYGALACYVSAFPDEQLLKDKVFYKLHNNYVRILNKIGIGMGRGECQVIRKNEFIKAGKYNNQIVAGEDFDLYRRLSKTSKIKFEKELHVTESPRRFRKYGYIKTITYWLLNSLYVMILKKSYSKEWEAVR